MKSLSHAKKNKSRSPTNMNTQTYAWQFAYYEHQTTNPIHAFVHSETRNKWQFFALREITISLTNPASSTRDKITRNAFASFVGEIDLFAMKFYTSSHTVGTDNRWKTNRIRWRWDGPDSWNYAYEKTASRQDQGSGSYVGIWIKTMLLHQRR